MVVTCWRPPRPCTGRSFATDRSVGASRRAAEQEATWPAHLPRGRLRSGVAMDPSDDGLGRMRRARPVGSPRDVAGLPSGHTAHVRSWPMLAQMIPPSGPPGMAVSASRHLCPVPRGWGRGAEFCHTTVTDHKKLSTSGFLRCSSPNGPAPDLGRLRAMCHLLRSCWAETTPLNKRPHIYTVKAS